jgi:hypothetical protein
MRLTSRPRYEGIDKLPLFGKQLQFVSVSNVVNNEVGEPEQQRADAQAVLEG